MFHSSLPKDGIAVWSLTTLQRAKTPANTTKGTVFVGFSNVDWKTLSAVYGWAGLQFQAWARGELYICGSQLVTVEVHVQSVGEFWIDGTQYFGGDFYSYRRTPVVVLLPPGVHKIDVRVTHDIRLFGASLPPIVPFTVEAIVAKSDIVVMSDKAVLSDIVDGTLVGKLISIPVRNNGNGWVEIVGVLGINVSASISS